MNETMNALYVRKLEKKLNFKLKKLRAFTTKDEHFYNGMCPTVKCKRSHFCKSQGGGREQTNANRVE